MCLNFDEIRQNAQEQGVNLQEIAIVYKGLTDNQIETMNAKGLLVQKLGNGGGIGKFSAEGEVLFAEMAVQVLYLGA